MSEQQTPLTYERILELFRETREQFRRNDLRFQERMDRMAQEAELRKQETDRKFQETAEQMKETDRLLQETGRKIQETWAQIKQTNKDVGGLTSSIGAIVANMVKGNIVEKFEALGYNDLDDCCEKKKFKNRKLNIKGEIDLFLENGNIAILIEVKTTLETKDVRDHIERLEKFRRYIDAKDRLLRVEAGGVNSPAPIARV